MKQGKYRAYIADGILVDAFEFRPQQALVVDFSGRITAIESPQELDPEIEVVDCSGSIFVAAPILAHSHLESFDAPCDDFDNSGFAQWVRSLLQWRESENRLSPQQSAAKSLELLSENGCGLVATHVAETGAEGDVESVLPEVQAFVEVFNPNSDIPQFEEFPFRGIALHAPYSVHDDIARHVFSMATDDDVISIHLGEHSQEREFLRNGEGELARLFMERQLPLKSRHYDSPIDWLESVGGLRSGVIAVHATDLSATELGRLNQAQVDVVFCPATHKYFNRPKPAFAEISNFLPALGCDSMASNSTLDPLHELRLACEIVPEISNQLWWQSLTVRGAEVLRRPDLGRLERGKWSRVLKLDSSSFGKDFDAKTVCDVLCNEAELAPELIALNSVAE